jgi:hypothetical protein
VSQGQASEQFQAQLESQMQSQSQAQSAAQVQTGFMVQQRRQMQVATRTAVSDVQPSTYLAIRRGSPGPAAMQVAVASLLMGLGFIARRPARAYARLRRTRR